MKKYIIEISLAPQVHEGCMAHYWQIIMITNDGKYTVAHGWSYNTSKASMDAENEARKRKLL